MKTVARLTLVLFPLLIGLSTSAQELRRLDGIGMLYGQVEGPISKNIISERVLTDTLLVALKSKLPRLPVEDGSRHDAASLLVTLKIAKWQGNWIGVLLLECRRPAFFPEDLAAMKRGTFGPLRAENFAIPIAWRTFAIIATPESRAKRNIKDALTDMVEQFAARYYRENN